MKNRIKALRSELGLTQQTFAEKLGTSRNNIAGYEAGTRIPSDAVVSLICNKFNVSENWLRTGEGEPFVKKSRSDEIREYVDRIQGVNDTFKAQFAAALAALEEEDWTIILDVVNDIKKRSMAEKKRTASAPAPSAVLDLTPEEQEIIRQHRERKSQVEEFGGSSSGKRNMA